MSEKITKDRFKEVRETAREQSRKVREIISRSKVMLFEIEEKRIERATACQKGEDCPRMEEEIEKLSLGLTEQYINFVEESKIYDELLEQIYYYNKERRKAEEAAEAEEQRRKLQELVESQGKKFGGI